jgi:hypothetical protein
MSLSLFQRFRWGSVDSVVRPQRFNSMEHRQSLRSGSNRQLNGKSCPLPRLTLDLDASAVGLH